MNKISKITVASVISVAAAGAFFGGNASAAATCEGGNISGQDCKMRITREVTNVSNPVTNTFSYTITAASGNPGTVTGAPASASIAMSAEAISGGKATKTADIDFSGATFSELGDYFFEVRESASGDVANYPKDDSVYRIIASVRAALDANDVPTGDQVITFAANMMNANDVKSGDYVFTSGAERTYIQATHKTTGNMSKDECFKYAINFPAVAGKAVAGDKYVVENSGTCTGGVEEITVGSDSNFVYLKSGDTVSVGLVRAGGQIPVGVDYTIALADHSDYDAYFDETLSSTKVSPSKTTVAQTSASFDSSNKTALRADKSAGLNTGILLNIFPFALLIAIAGAGTVFMVKKKQNVK